MSKAQQLRRAIIGLTIGLTVAGCETTRQSANDTDAFLRNAFDAYGVIDVVPTQNTRQRATAQERDADEIEQQVTTHSVPLS